MIRISKGLDERFWELFSARSENLRRHISQSLGDKGARPLVLGVFQKRNRCDGRDGMEANLERMLEAIALAANQGVQMLAMPEMALQGYSTPAGGSVERAIIANRELAVVVGKSEHLCRLQYAARTARMVVAFGFGEREGEAIYNSVGLIDADGTWLGVRRKNPLFPWDYESKVFAEPDPTLRCCVFQTRYGKVGLSDCFDGEFPETIRQMALEGAQVLLWCNAPCGDSKIGNSQRLNQSGAHAQLNGLYVACASCVSSDTTGSSCIYSPAGEPLVVLSVDQEELGLADANLALHTNWSLWRDRLHQWPLSKKSNP